MQKVSLFILFCFVFVNNPAKSQLTVNGVSFYIYSGATVTIQGDLSSNKNISGFGKIVLKGDTLQHLNMNGFSIPNLEIDNADSTVLTGDARISNSLLFTNGIVHAGKHNLTLADVASVSGMGPGKFIETGDTGRVYKEISADLVSNEIPVGAGNIYRPVFINTSGAYSAAKVGVRVRDSASKDAPPMISDYLKANWNITRTGITGSLNVSAHYNDSADVAGSEKKLKGYFYDGYDWSSKDETHDTILNTISFPITVSSGTLTAMDRFSLLKAKVFLQGAYNAATGVMYDNLRTPSNLIPLSDPYRTAPYNTFFTHVKDSATEVTSSSVFANQPNTNDNIVDWVFLELRDTSVASNKILQTRSALVQKDGDIVDVDGKSLVTFNNTDSGKYSIAVRHRNHLGLSTDPATFTPKLDEKRSTAVLVDFTTIPDAQAFGPDTAYAVATDGKHVLWGGNANMNNLVKYTGLNNDIDYLFINILNGDPNNVLHDIYTPADINLDRDVKYNGLRNDNDFLYNSVLKSSSILQRNQSLPN